MLIHFRTVYKYLVVIDPKPWYFEDLPLGTVYFVQDCHMSARKMAAAALGVVQFRP